MAIRIAGKMEKSLPNAVKLSKAELRAIAIESQITSKTMGQSLSDGLDKTGKTFDKIGRAGAKAFKTIATAAATSAAAVSAFSVKTGMEFDKQISTVKAVSGANKKQTKQLRDEAKYLGANSVFTANEVGQAMEYEARAGWKTKDMLAGTKGIMNATAADGGDLATVSDIITDNLTAFKKTAKEAEHMSDVLAATSASSNTNIEKLGETFKYVAPVAGSTGYSYEDVSLYSGIMANAGIKSSMAGTTQRNIITRILKPTKESATAMEKLDISATDSKGNMKSYDKLMQDISTSMKGLSKQDQSKYAAMLAGKTGMSGLLAVVNTSKKEYKELKKAIDESSGAAERMSKIRLDNLDGDITLFKSAMQGAGIEIYDELKEPLRDLVQGATEWIGDFSESFKTGFPTAVREIKEAGEAITDFAEPLLNVGEWMLDNPDVIAGTIAGIGTAVVGNKVARGVSNLTTSLTELGKGGWTVIGITAAVGTIAAIGTAIEVSSRQAKNASLDKHFGDIALSMDEIQMAAKEIVGSKKLEAVSELISAMDDVDKVASDMKSAGKEISKIEWKVSAGIKLSKDDMSSYEKSVSEYVSSAQDLIDKKGYEISIATNLLFGDTNRGNKLIKESNSFYKKLDLEVGELSDKINEKLEKAMKDGLSVDLEKELNDLLGQLSNITNAISEAKNEASWEVMKADWSGKDLDADSFKNLAKEVQDNVDELNAGAKDALDDKLEYLAAQKLLGEMSDKEYEKQVKEHTDAYQQTKANAKGRGIEFLYNTMMDTYGDKLANGGYEDGDVGAINDMMGIIKEMGPTGNIKRMTDQWDIIYNRIGQNKDLGFFNDSAVYLLGDVLSGFENGESFTTNVENANKNIKLLANEYFNPSEDSDIKIAKSMVENQQKYFDGNPLVFEKSIIEPAIEAANKASADIKNGIKANLGSGVTANLPITLNGTYSISAITSSGGDSSKTGKKATKPKPYAKGGIATEPTILVAEAGIPESVIPIERTQHSIDLWKKTGELLGIQTSVPTFSDLRKKMSVYGTGSTNSTQNSENVQQPVKINFSPHIVIQGNADEAMIQKALSNEYTRFEKMMNQYLKKRGRVSL